ncbi:MAG TPA: hypothetical protein VGH57_35165 [Amycolatopsis sp.]|jgi:hypothetical protein
MTDTVGPAPQYDAFADEFLDHAREGPYQKAGSKPTGKVTDLHRLLASGRFGIYWHSQGAL